MNWNYIKTIGDLAAIESESFERLAVIFKHSTRCHISKFALRQFETEFNSDGKTAPYFLDLLEHRDISNEIASRFGVVHQSPQLIVLKEGKVIFTTSHESIDANKIEQLI